MRGNQRGVSDQDCLPRSGRSGASGVSRGMKWVPYANEKDRNRNVKWAAYLDEHRLWRRAAAAAG